MVEHQTGQGWEWRGLSPGAPLEGTLSVPGSKSIAQRALVLAALTDGVTRFAGVPRAADVEATLGALAALGLSITPSGPRGLIVMGEPPGPGLGLGGRASDGTPRRAEVGESGTAARLLTAVVGLAGRAGEAVIIEGRGTLARRESPALLAALEGAGVGIEPLGEQPAGWPLRIRPIGPPPEVRLQDPGSSQEVTALLLALAAWPDELHLLVRGEVPSRPYLNLTRSVLALFGVRAEELPEPGGSRWIVSGPPEAPEQPLWIEPDASAAAVGLVAGSLSGGGVRIAGLSLASAQGDVRITEHLGAFGIEAGEFEGSLYATGRPTRGVDLDLRGEPDLAPPLAAVAAAAAREGHRSVLRGLETLPGKESSRIRVLAQGLASLGLEAAADDASLTIGPGPGRPGPGRGESSPLLLDPRGDHRMAFAFALLGLIEEGVGVRDPGCVAKSWPTFWEDLAGLGARVRGAGEGS